MNGTDMLEKSEAKDLPLAKIQVDSSYQRQVSDDLVDRIADDWHAVAAERITVSDRGDRPDDGPVKGGYFVVNGQHRCKAAVKLGFKTIKASVIDLRDVEDPAQIEAGLRLMTNVRMGDKPLERFKAQLRAGNEESLAIVKLLDRFDTEVNMTPTVDYGINCISTIEGLYRVDDGGLLRETLEVVRDSYGQVGGRNAGSNLLKGIAWFITRHAEESDRGRLCEKLSLIGVAALDRRARAHQSTMTGTLWMNFYRSMVELYNEKLREQSRLEWKTKGAGSFSHKLNAAWGSSSE